MIIDAYCLVFTLRLIVRLTKINFLIARLIAIKNFNRTTALVISGRLLRSRDGNLTELEPSFAKEPK